MSRFYIAWDGEGITDDAGHHYVLFGNSLGEFLTDRSGLHTLDIFDMLWDTHIHHPKAWHVIFGGSYDFNMWLRELSPVQCRMIWDGVPVRVGDYWVYYNQRAMTIERGMESMTIWDVWRFYQGSFVKALKQELPTFPQLPVIEAGKADRGGFKFSDIEEVKVYCNAELQALTLLMQKLDFNLELAEIGALRQMNGAGSIAGALLNKYRVKDHINTLPPEIDYASHVAYSGGRVELWKMGHANQHMYGYDLNSAYPFIIQSLPSLQAAKWRHAGKSKYRRDVPSFTVYRLRFDARHRRERGYPFFQRMGDGTILYPNCVEGWYWKPEVDAAMDAGYEECITILESWTLEPGIDTMPFEFVPEVYAFRKLLKELGHDGAQLVLKLGMNSLYGKLAQSVGAAPYRCLPWAGWITSSTRAAMFSAASQDPDAAVFIATDGILTTRPLKLDEGSALGQWSSTEYEDAITVQSGVYFLKYTCDKPDCCKPGDKPKWHDKYRGFDKGSIDPQVILAEWKAKHEKYYAPTTRFVTMGLCLQERKFDDWCQWRTYPRELDLTGNEGKRRALPGGRPHLRFVDMEPFSYPELQRSRAYKHQWTEAEPEIALDD